MKKLQMGILTVTAMVMASCGSNTNSPSNVAYSSSKDSDWCHASMRSSDSTNINFDYQVSYASSQGGQTRRNTLTSSWLNVSKFGFQGSERVHAAFVVSSRSSKYMYTSSSSYTSYLETRELDLRWDTAGQKFTAQIPDGLFLGALYVGDDQSFYAIYEVAVSVDGQWLSDPLNGTHNFRYVPMQQQPNSAVCSGQYFHTY